MAFHSSNYGLNANGEFRINAGINLMTDSKTVKSLKAKIDELEKKAVVETKVKFKIDDGEKREVIDAIKQITKYVDENGNAFTRTKVINAWGKTLQDTITKTNQSFKTLSEETTHTINNFGALETRIKKISSDGKEFTTLITQERDSLGRLTETTQILDRNLKPVGDSMVKIKDSTAIVNTEITKYIDNQGRLITETKKLNSAQNGTVERIIEEKTAEGQLVTTTEQYVVANNRLIESTRQSTTVTENDTIAIRENAQAQKDNVNATNEFVSTINKVVKFQLATKAITAFTTACREAVEVVKNFDSALTEFKKVSDLNGDSLRKYTKELGDLGKTVARTRTEMVEASTEFKKSGYSDEESAQLAQLAILYQNISDEEISAEESASFLISQMKAFNIPAEDALRIIDGLNEVSNNYAVSSADLANNLGKVSATLHANNVGYEEALGMLTAITEITRNASTGSRGLRILF